MNYFSILGYTPVQPFKCKSLAAAFLALVLPQTVFASPIISISSGGISSSASTISYATFQTSADLTAQCSACISVTSPGSLVGDGLFDLNLSGSIGEPFAAVNDGSGYYSQQVSTSGSVFITQGRATLFSAAFESYKIIAVPNSSQAVFELSYVSGSSTLLTGLPSTGYLDFSGSTSNPIVLSSVNTPNGQYLTLNSNINLDWMASVSTTPFNPAQQTVVPAPSSVWLFASAIAGFTGLNRRINKKV